MIDIGRQKDMEQMMAYVNDDNNTVMQRRRAYRTMANVRRKMRDEFILKQRLRLIAATMANDLLEMEKISNTLQQYENKYYLNRKF